MKIIAHGLGISSLRRDNLYALTYGLVDAYSQHKNLQQLAAEMISLTTRSNELQFMCSSFDAVLKKYHKATLMARSTLVTALRMNIRTAATSRREPRTCDETDREQKA